MAPDTVRYYESIGLLPTPARGANGYRTYGPETVALVRFIRKAQAIGFSLADVRRIIRVRGSGRAPCDDVIKLARRQLRAVEDQLKELAAIRRLLRGCLRAWRQNADPTACASSLFCDLIEQAGSVPPRPAPQRPAFSVRPGRNRKPPSSSIPSSR